MAKLGEYISIQASTKLLSGDDFWLLNLDMVEQHTGRVIEYNRVSADKLDGSIIQFDTNCVLYSKLRPNLNKVVLPEIDGFATSEMLPLVPDKSVICREYLAEYLRSDHFVTWAISKTAGAKMPRLGSKELLSKELYLPPLETQKQIAATLDKVADLINKRKQQLEKLDELVKARFVEMFGDPVVNPLNWTTESLKNVTSKIGSGATPKGGKESYQSEGITLIRSMNVHDGRFEYKDLAHITDEQAKQLDNVAIEENDVFINITGASVARSCIVPKHILPARVNQHVAIIRCISTLLNPVFANNMFLNNSFKGQLLDIGESSGATRQAITKQELESLTVVLPPIKLQGQFAAFVSQTDKSKQQIQQSLEKLETLKKSLMQEYFG